MQKTNPKTSPWAPYFRHGMLLCFSYQFSCEQGRAVPNLSSFPHHPSWSQGHFTWLSLNLPGDSCPSTFLEDTWPLLSFPTDSPVKAAQPWSKHTSQDSLTGSSSPGKQGPLIQEVCPLACLQLSWLQVPGYCCLSGGFCYCSPSNWALTWGHQSASQKGFTNKPTGYSNLLHIIPEKGQLSKPMNCIIHWGLVH